MIDFPVKARKQEATEEPRLALLPTQKPIGPKASASETPPLSPPGRHSLVREKAISLNCVAKPWCLNSLTKVELFWFPPGSNAGV